MEKMKAFWEDKRCTYAILLIGICGIFFYFGRKVPLVNGVWELADEYGYLSNAAYLTKTNWNYMVNLYYGYGYSILLVPLFLLFDTGIEIIHGAVWVNISCLALLLVVQYVLLSKLFKSVDSKVIALVSGALCFYPYHIVSVLKVMPECLLALMVWVCGLLLYQALDTGKWQYYVFLAVSVAYTFLVHTRAMIFCAAIFLIVVIAFLQRKNGWKWLLIFLGVCVVLFAIGFLLKNQLIDDAYSKLLSEESDYTANTVSLGYVIDRITSFFTDFDETYLYSVFCKMFYLIVSTVGMYPMGIYAIVKDTILEWKTQRKIGIENAIKIMFGLASLLMIAALIVHAPGNYEKTSYFYYSRYYEYLVGPVAAVGILYCIRNKVKIWEAAVIAAALLLSAWRAEDLSRLLPTQGFYYDGNRLSGFSLFLTWFDQYSAVIETGLWFAGILILVIFLLSRFRVTSYAVPLVLFAVFFLNDRIIVNNTLGINATNIDEKAVAECVHEFADVDEVYLLESEDYRIIEYTSMQSLLGKQKLNIIGAEQLEQLEEGDLLIIFYHDPRMEGVEQPYEKLMEAGAYELFVAK